MADDFVGVPFTEWRDLDARARMAASLAFTVLCLLALLTLTLVSKGIITWADLMPRV